MCTLGGRLTVPGLLEFCYAGLGTDGLWRRYLALFASTFRVGWNVRPKVFLSYLAQFSSASTIHLYCFRDASPCAIGLGIKRPLSNICPEFFPTLQDTDGPT